MSILVEAVNNPVSICLVQSVGVFLKSWLLGFSFIDENQAGWAGSFFIESSLGVNLKKGMHFGDVVYNDKGIGLIIIRDGVSK